MQAGKQIRQSGKDREYTVEEMEQISRSVGISAIKYADLCNQRTRDYRFSFTKMLSFKGNTASYMLYSFARINNIIRKIGIERTEIYDPQRLAGLEITEPQERNLLVTLLKLDHVIREMSNHLMPHNLCDWMYQVSQAFTDFYENCRVISQDGVNRARLVLCEMTRQALRFSFHILGLKEVDRM